MLGKVKMNSVLFGFFMLPIDIPVKDVIQNHTENGT